MYLLQIFFYECFIYLFHKLFFCYTKMLNILILIKMKERNVQKLAFSSINYENRQLIYMFKAL